jgi:AcrR family transcriptional regulator
MRTVKDPTVRKSEIVSASVELFLKNGYEKTTVENIIQQLGVAKGCFYHHFRSKDEVFEACIISLSSSLMRTYLSILEDERKPAKQRLMEYVDYNFQITEQQPELLEAIHSQGYAEVHERVMQESIQQILPTFIRLIEQIQAENGARDMDAAFSAVALLGAFRAVHAHYSHQPGLGMDRLKELTIEMMEGILQTRLR